MHDIRLVNLPYYSWYKPLVLDPLSNPIFLKHLSCTRYSTLTRDFSLLAPLGSPDDNYTALSFDHSLCHLLIGSYSPTGHSLSVWDYPT